MNITAVLRDSWRITWKGWPLWVLNLLMFCSMLPTMTLAGTLGGIAGALSNPLPSHSPPWLADLWQLPAWVWILVSVGLVPVLALFTTLTWVLQTATVRGAALAAEHGSAAFIESLRLGWRRVFSLFQLGLTFGLCMMALAVLPLLLILLLRGPEARSILNFVQVGLTPINTVLGLALFLVMMSIAIENQTPLKAFRRAWGVFRLGWWGFLLVFGITTILSTLMAVLVLPLIILLPVVILSPQLGAILLLGYCCIAGPLGMFIMLFIAVFTTTLYTLTYRAAAATATTPAPV